MLPQANAGGYLSPTIVEAILNGQFPEHLTMKDLIAPFPMERSGGGRWNIFSAAVARFKAAESGLGVPVVNGRSAQPAQLIKLQSAVTGQPH